MAKAKTIPFRGAQFRHIDQRVGDGGCFVRCHMESDITPELAEEFGWEIYANQHLVAGLEGTTKLTGELNLQELSFAANGTNSDPLETTAIVAEDFQLSRRKDDAGGIETRLRFVLRSKDWKEITGYFGLMGQVDGFLKLELLADSATAQKRLGEEDDDGDDDDWKEGEKAKEKEPKSTRKRGERPEPAVAMEKVQ